MPQKVLDLSRVKLKGTAWERMSAVDKNYAKDKVLLVRFGGRVIKLSWTRTDYDGMTKSLSLKTMVTRPKAVDPKDSFSVGVGMHWDRFEYPDVEAQINLISKKPSHNIPSGSFAIRLAFALAKVFKSKYVTLHDASSLPCESKIDPTIKEMDLRRFHMFVKGTGWYESFGFKSFVEKLKPRDVAKHVHGIHRISIAKIRPVIETLDGILRDGIMNNKKLEGRILFSKIHDVDTIAPAERELRINEAMDLCKLTSGFLVATKGFAGTLGQAVQRAMKTDCVLARDIMNLFVPSGNFIVLTKSDGRTVPELPYIDDALFAWDMYERTLSTSLRAEVCALKTKYTR